MAALRGNLMVQVTTYRHEPIIDATVTLTGAGGMQHLKPADDRGGYVAPDVHPGAYQLTVKSKGFETQERDIQVKSGGGREVFLLGPPGMPYYYRGNVMVPFEPINDLVAVVYEEDPSAGIQGEADALTEKIAAQHGLTSEPVGENIARNGIHIMRLPESLPPEETGRLLQSVAEHPEITAAGALLHLSGENATLLTNELIVRFAKHTSEEAVEAVASKYGLKIAQKIVALGNVYRMKLDMPASYEVLEVCRNLARVGGVEYAEPNLIHTVEEDTVTPTDFLFPEQWDHTILNTPGAWGTLRRLNGDHTYGDPGVIIAVVDSGVDPGHQEFAGNVSDGSSKTYRAFDFANMVPNNNSLGNRHGTACASAATARADNPSGVTGVKEGVAGVAGNCRLLAIRHGGPEARFAEAYLWAGGFDPGSSHPRFPAQISPGADIITSSFGFSINQPISGLMRDTFDRLTDDGRGGRGTLLFFSAGNENVDLDTTFRRPWGMYERCFSVAASSLGTDGVTEIKAQYSNHGTDVEFCAPSSDGFFHNPPRGHEAYAATIRGQGNIAGTPVRTLSLAAATAPGTDTVTVNSTAGLTTDQAIMVGEPGAGGTESCPITAIDAATGQLTLGRTLRNGHAAGTVVYAARADYAFFGGTSHATPLAAGVAALMLTANPDLRWDEVRDIFRETAVKIDANSTDPVGRWRDTAGRISSDAGYAGPFFSRFYGYGRIDADAAVKRAGWLIDLHTPNLVFQDVPAGETTVRAVRFTVQSLWGATFEVVNGPGSPFSLPMGPTASIPGSASFSTPRDVHLWVGYTATSPGDTAADSVTIRNRETGQEWTIPMTANAVERKTAAVMLTLDRSGSMDFDSGIPGQQRIDVLRFSANILVDVLRAGDAAGVVTFDHEVEDVLVPPAGPLPEPGTFGDPHRNALRTAIDGIVPRGRTAIGSGVLRAQTRLNGVGGYGTRSTIVFTDGQENEPEYINDVADTITDRVFAIGLGMADFLNPSALNALTNGTGGYLLLTGALDNNSRFRLAKYFLQILAGIRNEDVVLDPDGWVAPGQKVRIPFRLNEADLAADIMLLLPAHGVIQMELETPAGRTIRMAEASALPGSTYYQGDNITLYRLSLPAPVDGGAREGTWHAVLTLDEKYFYRYWEGSRGGRMEHAAAAAHGAQYTLLVHAYSNLRMACRLQQDTHEPGATMTLEAELTEFGLPVENRARVTARLTLPDGRERIVELEETEPGVFTAEVAAPTAGIYHFRVMAEGATLRGIPFTREAVRTGAVWQGGGEPFPTDKGRSRSGGGCGCNLCHLIRCLFESGSVTPAFEKRLAEVGIDPKGLRRCLEDTAGGSREPVPVSPGRPILTPGNQERLKRLEDLLSGTKGISPEVLELLRKMRDRDD